MLGPIPQQLLRDMVTIKVCTGVDAWQKPTWQETTVRNVHIQNTNEVRKSATNTEVVLRSILFIDGRRSRPRLDYEALAMQSEAAGRPMRAVVRSWRGNLVGDYEVLSVDSGPDVPSIDTHHVELGLV